MCRVHGGWQDPYRAHIGSGRIVDGLSSVRLRATGVDAGAPFSWRSGLSSPPASIASSQHVSGLRLIDRTNVQVRLPIRPDGSHKRNLTYIFVSGGKRSLPSVASALRGGIFSSS